MADEPSPEELEQPEPQPERDQFGNAIDRVNRLREAGQLVSRAAKGVAAGAKKLAVTLVGPGSKIKILGITVLAGSFFIALVIFFIGLTLSTIARQGTGGTTPPNFINVAHAETRDRLQLLECFMTKPTGSSDPDDEEHRVLSTECQTIIREKVDLIQGRVDLYKDRIESIEDASDKQKATQMLQELEAALNALDAANGKYVPSKEASLVLLNLLSDPAFFLLLGGNSETGAAITQYALDQVGKNVWESGVTTAGRKQLTDDFARKRGSDPNRIRCASFVGTAIERSIGVTTFAPGTHYNWALTGKTFAGNNGQRYQVIAVDKSELQPGDIVYWGNSPNPADIWHTGIYVGDGQAVDTSSNAQVVKLRSLDRSYTTYVGAQRLVPTN